MEFSAVHALNEREKEFCLIWASMKFHPKMRNEAWRRAFFPEVEQADGLFTDNEDTPKAAVVAKKAEALAKNPRIAAWIAEMGSSSTAAAVNVLGEQVLMGDEKSRRDAAKMVFAQEEQLETRNATELFKDIMCAIGAEVVVDLPNGTEAVVSMRDMFPDANMAIPEDVVERSMRSLVQRIEVLEAEKAEREEVDAAI